MKDTDFSEVHAAQVAAFDAALPMVALDDIKGFDHALIDDCFTSPTLLIEASEMVIDPDKKGSAGTMWVNVEFMAHCILPRSKKRAYVEIECINFAGLVMKVVNQNKWGLPNVGSPEQLRAIPGSYSKDPKGFASWIVTWWQTVAIGEGWQMSSQVPDDVLISESPKIGIGHENDYEALTDGFINTPAS